MLFEGCAGGGGRLDLGNLCYLQQFWTSDDTDARQRVKIQDGTSYGYPQTIMGAHVSACPNHQTGDSNPLETRFNVACGGVLGYELDMSKFSEEELEIVSKQIAFYKEYRKVLQFGDYYRLGDAFGENVTGFMTVSKDKNTAVAVVIAYEYIIAGPELTIGFKGLNPSAVYEVTTREQDNYKDVLSFTAGGDLLMNGKIPMRDLYADTQSWENSRRLYARMFVFKKAK